MAFSLNTNIDCLLENLQLAAKFNPLEILVIFDFLFLTLRNQEFERNRWKLVHSNSRTPASTIQEQEKKDHCFKQGKGIKIDSVQIQKTSSINIDSH